MRISTPIGSAICPMLNEIQPEPRQNGQRWASLRSATCSLGFQILFGVDYAVTEATSLGLKGRWVRFGSFSDDFIWNPLRSHEPYLRKKRASDREPVSGRLKTERRRIFRRQREPEVSFLDHSDFFCLGLKIANVSPNLPFICHSCPFSSVIPAVCKRESSLGFWGVDRVQGKS